MSIELPIAIYPCLTDVKGTPRGPYTASGFRLSSVVDPFKDRNSDRTVSLGTQPESHYFSDQGNIGNPWLNHSHSSFNRDNTKQYQAKQPKFETLCTFGSRKRTCNMYQCRSRCTNRRLPYAHFYIRQFHFLYNLSHEACRPNSMSFSLFYPC